MARNAALSAVSTRWLAFIDDDEVASPRWLGELLALRDGAHAIFGPCEAVYGEGIPSWIKGADLHSNRVPAGLFPIKTGYTSNVLIDVDFVRRYKLKFDLRLGRSGGEDTMFFREMYQLGATLKYAPEAFVFEEVIPSRTTVKWVASRRYRTGQTYALILRRFSKLRYLSAAWSSPPKIMLCMIMSVCTAPHIVVASFWLMRGIFHIGVLCYALGFSVHQEYRSTPATQKES